MKTKITLLKSSLVALFLLTGSTAWSAAVPLPTATYYTCVSTPLNFNAVATAPEGTTTFLWDIKKDGTQFGTPSSTAPTSFAAPGVYTVILVSNTDAASGTCSSDPVTSTVVVLPPLGITLGAPSRPTYCAIGQDDNATSVIIPAPTGFDTAYDQDLDLAYTYTVTKGTDAPVTIDASTTSTLGTVNPDGTFTLKTRDQGTYTVKAGVKYVQATSNTTNPLLGNGCPAETSETEIKTITVTPQPSAPTITITLATN